MLILKIKKKIIFAGKLNSAKGYDLFGSAVCKVLDKHKDWEAIVAGDEPREKLIYNHKKFKVLGFQTHDKILKLFEKSSIAVVCSRWNEPFGRTSLEASSRGCAIIISNRGGLKETTSNAIVLKNLSVNNLYNSICKLIKNKKNKLKIQKKTLKNFYLTNSYICNKIDTYRQNFKNQKI